MSKQIGQIRLISNICLLERNFGIPQMFHYSSAEQMCHAQELSEVRKEIVLNFTTKQSCAEPCCQDKHDMKV